MGDFYCETPMKITGRHLGKNARRRPAVGAGRSYSCIIICVSVGKECGEIL
jgi:hypothetical protein